MSDQRADISARIRRARMSGPTDRYPLFLMLLIVDVVLLLVIPAGSGGIVIVAPFIAATLLLGLYTSDANPRTLRAATIAGLVVVVSAVIAAVTGRDQVAGLVWLMLGALVIATPWSILRRIFLERTVTLRTIFAAVSVYVLIGLSFAFIDLGVQGLLGAFFTQSGVHGPADFVYFSYIAMTTVGFGDLTPAAGLPRALVVPEVILGQVFLVTTVARLVSMYGMPQPDLLAEATAETPAGDENTAD